MASSWAILSVLLALPAWSASGDAPVSAGLRSLDGKKTVVFECSTEGTSLQDAEDIVLVWSINGPAPEAPARKPWAAPESLRPRGSWTIAPGKVASPMARVGPRLFRVEVPTDDTVRSIRYRADSASRFGRQRYAMQTLDLGAATAVPVQEAPASAAAEGKPASAPASPWKGLVWPVACRLGYDVSPCDFRKNLKTGPTGFCNGHRATDIGFPWEAMDRGIDVLAADDGVVQWAFDGKHDRCPDRLDRDCQDSTENPPGSSQGKVVCTELGPYCGNGDPANGRCYWCFTGNSVVILHRRPGVFATRYDHFKKYSILVKPGDKVTRGQVIGQVGSSGNSSGPHLHFEVWGGGYYDPVDPWAGSCGAKGQRWLWAEPP